MTRVTIQTFERDVAKYLKTKCDYDIVYLVDTEWQALTPKGLDEVATFATVVSPWKEVLDPKIGTAGYIKSANETVDTTQLQQLGGFIAPINLIREAHKRGLRLVGYTYYDSHEMEGDRKAELNDAMARGIDGLFVENVAEAILIRELFKLKTSLIGKY
jgi:glycerophosphoryl diester phosphodiesterase